MTFVPAVPFGGFAGFRIFDTTAVRQREAFGNSDNTQRNIAYFREKIIESQTASALVQDRRLLEVALGAFGLSEEIDKRAFVRRILEDGTDNARSFANRIGDPRWRAFAEAFSYGNATQPPLSDLDFQNTIINQYKDRAFEESVGAVQPDFRLALNFRREIPRIAVSETAERNGWLQVLAQRPLRAVIEAALGLPSTLASLDLDQQRETIENRAQQVFGSRSPSVFTDGEIVEDAIRRFFVQRDLQSGPSAATPGATSLTLLSSSPRQSVQAINLILSNASPR